MALISANNLGKSFGARDVFTGIELSVPHGARAAIVGPNGVGKTTLLRILVGLDEPSTGQVQRARKLSIGYLPQEAVLTGGGSLWEQCLQAFDDLREMESTLSRLEAEMADPNKMEEALERYGRLQENFERRGGYLYETRIRQTLTGLGFEERDLNRPLEQLSGGQRTRAYLARLLLSDPDLLVLDEPTNHLDIQAVEWLEGYLSQWEGAALIVSHDRYFLDRVADHILEMSPTHLDTYRGNYSHYLQQRQERWDRLNDVFEDERQRLEKELDYVKRNISGQNTRQAKGKLRRLSREVEAIQSLGIRGVQGKSWSEVAREADISEHTMGVAEVEQRIRSLRPPTIRPPLLHFNIKAHARSGDLVLRTRDLEIGYADEGKPLFLAPDLLLKRGECAAVIGPNGAGKTTFLRTLLGKMPPLSGDIILGASLEVAYFAQAHEELNPERTLMQEIEASAPGMLPAEIRDYLARYLFTGEEPFKRVSTLSGGERGRLALAKLSLARSNLLLLDEPTNHLDIPSQEVLQEVLSEYQGTILLVSHDRYLIDALGSQIWAIDPDQTSLEVFEGTYSQYRDFKEAQKAEAQEGTRQEGERRSRRDGRAEAEARRRQTRLEEVEHHIAALEGRLETLGSKLESPPEDPFEVQRLGEEYVQVQHELEEMMREWAELHVP